jgi:hypothetical protein
MSDTAKTELEKVVSVRPESGCVGTDQGMSGYQTDGGGEGCSSAIPRTWDERGCLPAAGGRRHRTESGGRYHANVHSRPGIDVILLSYTSFVTDGVQLAVVGQEWVGGDELLRCRTQENPTNDLFRGAQSRLTEVWSSL